MTFYHSQSRHCASFRLLTERIDNEQTTFTFSVRKRSWLCYQLASAIVSYLCE